MGNSTDSNQMKNCNQQILTWDLGTKPRVQDFLLASERPVSSDLYLICTLKKATVTEEMELQMPERINELGNRDRMEPAGPTETNSKQMRIADCTVNRSHRESNGKKTKAGAWTLW